jgi:hypothetical protein
MNKTITMLLISAFALTTTVGRAEGPPTIKPEKAAQFTTAAAINYPAHVYYITRDEACIMNYSEAIPEPFYRVQPVGKIGHIVVWKIGHPNKVPFITEAFISRHGK